LNEVNPDYFQCKAAINLINDTKKVEFANTAALQRDLVDKMNTEFGADVHMTHFNEFHHSRPMYLIVKCKYKGCPYSHWYYHDKKSTTGPPRKLIFARSIN
jgi:hypothetical protein